MNWMNIPSKPTSSREFLSHLNLKCPLSNSSLKLEVDVSSVPGFNEKAGTRILPDPIPCLSAWAHCIGPDPKQ